MNTKLIFFLTLIFLLFSCNTDDENAVTYPETLELTYDFQNDNQSWEGDFAYYPLGEESFNSGRNSAWTAVALSLLIIAIITSWVVSW